MSEQTKPLPPAAATQVITFEGKQVIADKNGDVVRENDDNEKIEPEVENFDLSAWKDGKRS